jgi:hypothetical protein
VKQFVILFPVSAAGFTFAFTLLIAVINGATLITSIGRGFLSALVILLTSLFIRVVINRTFVETKAGMKNSDQMPSCSTRNPASEASQPGYNYLTAKRENTQVAHDLVELLQANPGRATELLRKMKAE